MEHNERSLLSRLPSVEAPSDFLSRIMKAIQVARMRQLRNRFALLLSGFALSLGYAIFNWSALLAEISASSFVGFVRLAVSDPDIIFANAKDLLFGLLETFPVWSALLMLLGAFFLVGAVAFAEDLRNARRARTARLIPLNGN